MTGLRTEVVADFIDRSVEDQTWYRQNANVVNGTAAGLAGAAAFLLTYTQTTGSWPGLEGALVFLAPVLSAVALKLTRNGIGEVQAAELKRKAAMEDRQEDRELVRHETPALGTQVSRETPAAAPAPRDPSRLPVYTPPREG